MDLVILGPGRLGRSLAALLRETDWSVTLLGRGDAVPDGLPVLLTVPDSAIPEVAGALSRGRPVLHCSGAADVDILRPHRPAGSWHPLMTFPGPEVALPDLVGVPAALAGDPECIALGRALAESLGMAPLEVPGDRRLYHAAAVMAGNFATVLLAEAARVLQEAGVPADRAAGALAPLALTSLRNAAEDPAAALTGPAARGDLATIQTHLRALRSHDLGDQEAIYRVLNQAALRIVSDRGTDSEPDQD